MRKIFGRRELFIIEKQLLGVRLKASEKMRLSRDIRKKFEAISALIPFNQDFQLKHGLLIKDMINEAREIILESKYLPKIKRIVLFGSVTENQLTLRSDIDIAVEFVGTTKKEATQFRLDMLKKVNEKIDIQVYNILPHKIQKEIDLKGRVIYEQKNQG
ncbi:nucleotidyltransferase domain-containing protein [Candidatus Pacearchaeota archaeon]|nr:nucleotidyltransferase domain-containing protein [Candidatus Pacearchaeota archaeon]